MQPPSQLPRFRPDTHTLARQHTRDRSSPQSEDIIHDAAENTPEENDMFTLFSQIHGDAVADCHCPIYADRSEDKKESLGDDRDDSDRHLHGLLFDPIGELREQVSVRLVLGKNNRVSVRLRIQLDCQCRVVHNPATRCS